MNFADDILIVDDEIPNLRLLAELLRKEGYRVRPTAKARTAIDSARAKPPGLLLLDVRMPEMDGFELCRRLKQDERTRNIPIIFVSSLQEIDDKVRGFEAGGVDFISKPYQEQEIVARVRTHMSLDQMRQQLEQRTAQLEQEVAERKRAEEALQASEQFLQRTLDTLTTHIAILDEGGVIVGLNGAWRQFAQNNHMTWPDHGLGRNCLAVLDAVSGEATASAQQAAAGIRAVIAGERDYFQLEYHCHSPTERCWFVMHVTRFDSEKGVRVVTAHENITERKQAELALQQSNQALKQRLDELATLNLIGQTVSTVVDLPDALDVVVGTITRSFNALGTGIVLLSDDRSELTLIALFDRRFPVASITGKSGDVPTNSVQRGMVYPVDEDSSLIQALLGQGQTTVISDAQHDPRLAPAHHILQAAQIGCLMLVPLLSKGKVIGLIGIASDQPEREFTPDEVMLTETIAGQIAGAIELGRLFEQAQQLAITKERSRLARDLHDSVTQSLFTNTLFAQAGRKRIQAGNIDGASHYLIRILETSHQALKEMRLFVYELLPEKLTQFGLVGAIQQRVDAVEKRAGIDVQFNATDLSDLPGPINEALYRITQEALNNVLKHAQADKVTITLSREARQISLQISDNGSGFNPEEVQGGIGLQSMVERVGQMNGEFLIESAPQQGTKITVVLEMTA